MSRTEEQQFADRMSSLMLPCKIQWLAATAGCVTGIALLGLGWIASFSATFLIAGAVVTRWFPLAGRWFTFVSALLLSVAILPIWIANFAETIKVSFTSGLAVLGMGLAWLLSPVLLICCITVVVKDLVKHAQCLPSR